MVTHNGSDKGERVEGEERRRRTPVPLEGLKSCGGSLAHALSGRALRPSRTPSWVLASRRCQEQEHCGRVEEQRDRQDEPAYDYRVGLADQCCQIPHRAKVGLDRAALALSRGLFDLEVGEDLRLDRELVGKTVALRPAVVRRPRCGALTGALRPSATSRLRPGRLFCVARNRRARSGGTRAFTRRSAPATRHAPSAGAHEPTARTFAREGERNPDVGGWQLLQESTTNEGSCHG
jgi:hypothetical protein